MGSRQAGPPRNGQGVDNVPLRSSTCVCVGRWMSGGPKKGESGSRRREKIGKGGCKGCECVRVKAPQGICQFVSSNFYEY